LTRQQIRTSLHGFKITRMDNNKIQLFDTVNSIIFAVKQHQFQQTVRNCLFGCKTFILATALAFSESKQFFHVGGMQPHSNLDPEGNLGIPPIARFVCEPAKQNGMHSALTSQIYISSLSNQHLVMSLGRSVQKGVSQEVGCWPKISAFPCPELCKCLKSAIRFVRQGIDRY